MARIRRSGPRKKAAPNITSPHRNPGSYPGYSARRVWAYAHQLRITTTADQLDPDTKKWAIERGADAALDNSRAAVIVGSAGDELVVCLTGCCVNRPGVLIVLPDLTVAEGHANGLRLPPATWRLERADGRSVAVFAGVGRG